MQPGDGGAAAAAAEVARVVTVELEQRVGAQEPRIWSAPAYASTVGQEAIELARACGLELDPWQELVLVDSLGCRHDGRFAAFEVGVNVARQNGKGGILEARELASVELLGDRLVIHSAHEFPTSSSAMDRMEELLEEGGLTSKLRGRPSRSHGSEGFKFVTGQRIWYRTRTSGGGRGFSADLVVLDEAMILKETFIGALMPTMSARSITGNPQLWYTGSAVDQTVHEHGIVFARLRARGLAGGDPSLAYFEWSAADPVDEEGKPVTPDRLEAETLADPEAWAAANPGLGIRISGEHVEKELRSMDRRTFAVERLGVGDWPAVDEDAGAVIPIAKWNELFDLGSRPVDPVCFAFDVRPDRSFSSIGVAGAREDGLKHVEVVDRRRGTAWVAPRVAELLERHDAIGVFCDPFGPAGSLLHEFEDLGIAVQTVDARDYANACGLIFDLVEEAGMRHIGTAELVAAVKHATKRPLGEAWAWSRKGGIDISPLVACTLALWGSVTGAPAADAWVAVW